MKILYLESKKKLSSDPALSSEQIKELPKNILLAYSIQYKDLAELLKKQLESNKIHIKGFTQVLGCSKIKSSVPILLIGSGRFHAINLALESKQEVYIYNNSLSKISKEEIEALSKQKIGKLSKILHSINIGILISTKPGQKDLVKAEAVKKLLESKGKKVFMLVSNQFNLSEFENFEIDFFINTACSGISRDSSKILNADDILEFFGK